MKIWINILGCPKNEADSSSVAALLKNKGHEIVNTPEKADLLIVNTCGFIEAAKEESVDAILNAVRYGKDVIVHGCLVQRYYEELRKELPEVRAFLGVVTPQKLVEAVELRRDFVGEPVPVYEFHGREEGKKPYAYLKVGDGCNRKCAFCAIPSIKGPLVNRKIEDVVREAEYLVSLGKKEIILVSQDLTQYRWENGTLVDLLKKLDTLKGDFWIRLLYLYPDGVNEELLDFVASSSHVLHYFDIPIQHASPRILKLMRRNEKIENVRRIFENVRRKMSDAILRTTVMVGFPTETEEDFKFLKDFVKDIGFDRLGTFMYSDEEGTKAYELSNKVPKHVSRQRFNSIMELQQKMSLERNSKHVGRSFKTLVEGKEGELYYGRTYMDAPEIDGYVHFSSKMELHVGEFVNVRITDYEFYDLEGEA